MQSIQCLLIFILWTWGLTPTWVNIIGTILLSLELLEFVFGD